MTIHRIGGHTAGLQCVRVHTKRGWVVLASDTSHYYEHFEKGRVFPTTFHIGTRASVKNTSANSAAPFTWRNGRISIPGVFRSAITHVMPRCFGALGSVRMSRKIQSE